MLIGKLKLKILVAIINCFSIIFTMIIPASAEITDESISAEAAVLMEADTGTVIYEKNSDMKLAPASITKIMTLLIIFDSIKSGQISLNDMVITSEYAASMGGSQVFLEAGEEQSVETLIKCIAVASANDACVAMAEHICGSETSFVEEMNKRALELGMKNTHFVNCNGLDTENHYSSALDVAIMSKELITQYSEIKDYSTIWMENIVHKTSKGEKDFGLTNTNKLIKQYPYATGLKTGSTASAKYCVSATAEKEGVKLIAVIMSAPDYNVRFTEASTLLEYGFGVCRVYNDENMPELKPVYVSGGKKEYCDLIYENDFSYIDMDDIDFSMIKKDLVLNDKHIAPIEAGSIAGHLIYSMDGKEIGNVPVLYSDNVEKAGIMYCIKKAFAYFYNHK